MIVLAVPDRALGCTDDSYCTPILTLLLSPLLCNTFQHTSVKCDITTAVSAKNELKLKSYYLGYQLFLAECYDRCCGAGAKLAITINIIIR